MAGTLVGYAWGLACLGAGLRWSTLTLSDLEVATRLVGPTLGSGSVAVRAGMAVAVLGAVLGEAQVGGFFARTWGERLAAAMAVAALPPLFVAGGATEPMLQAAGRWAVPSALATAGVLLLQPVVGQIRPILPVALTVAGLVLALLGS